MRILYGFNWLRIGTVTPYSPVGAYHATYITWPNSHPNRYKSEDRSSISLWNIGIHLQVYTVSKPPKQHNLYVWYIWVPRGNGFEEYYRLAFDAVQSGRNLLTFRRNNTCLLFACYLHHLLFHPKNGGITFLRNVGKQVTDYTASYARRQDLLLLLSV
jgi:hypothetical protein